MLYFDTTGVPFYPVSDAGLKIAAHFYNHNIATKPDGFTAVMFGKILTDEQKEALVWDVERGAPDYISDKPWQTCTCLGDWHYNTGVYEKNRYKSPAQVIRLLADVVSKNGNLLLNVPLRGDGTFDEKEERIIMEIGDWMAVNGEGIYSTRPWHIFGEGPIAESSIAIKAQGFNEGSYVNAGSREIRFTQTPKYLYAIVLDWPEDNVVNIKTLAKGNSYLKKNIKSVELLGYGKVKCNHTDEGLTMKLPADAKHSIAPVIKIRK